MSDKLKDLGKQLIKYSYEEIPNEKFKNNLELYDFLKELLKDVSEEDYNNLYTESLELISKLKTITDEKFLLLAEEWGEKYSVLIFSNFFRETNELDKCNVEDEKFQNISLGLTEEKEKLTKIAYDFSEMVHLLSEKYDSIELPEFFLDIGSLYCDLRSTKIDDFLEKRKNKEETKLEIKYQEKKELYDISKMSGPEVAQSLTQDFLTDFPNDKFNDEIEMLYCWNKTLETLTTEQFREILNLTFSVLYKFTHNKESRIEEFYALSDEIFVPQTFFKYFRSNMSCREEELHRYVVVEDILEGILFDDIRGNIMNYFLELAESNTNIENWDEISAIKQQDEQWKIYCDSLWKYNKYCVKRNKISSIMSTQINWRAVLNFKNKKIEFDVIGFNKVLNDWYHEQVEPFYEILTKRETENETC